MPLITRRYTNNFSDHHWSYNIPHSVQPLDQIIENLKVERINGNKLGLIIGRKDDEYIPNELGWIWISLDFQERKDYSSNRYHFKIDVNKPRISYQN